MSYCITQDRPGGLIGVTSGTDQSLSARRFGSFATMDEALRAVFANGVSGDIVLGPGKHRFAGSVTIPRACTIRWGSSTVLVPDHSGAIGCFEFTANDSHIQAAGGGILVSTAVNDQVMVKFTNVRGYSARGFYIDFDTEDGTSDNPMTGLSAESCVYGRVTDMSIYPGMGTRGWYFEDGSFLKFDHCHWGSKSGGTLLQGDLSPNWTHRNGWRGVEVNGTSYHDICDACTFHAVGIVNDGDDLDDDEDDVIVDKAIYVHSSNFGESSTDEQGHSRCRGFIMEGVDARNSVYITGQQFYHLHDGEIGAASACKQFDPSMNRYDCAVFFGIQASGPNQKGNPNITVSGLKIHNHQFGPMESNVAPPQMYISGVDRAAIFDNDFELMKRGPGIIINHATSAGVAITGNRFFSNEVDEAPPVAIKMLTLTAQRVEAGRFTLIANNVARGMANPFTHVHALPLGFTGPVNPVGVEFDPNMTITGTMDFTVKASSGSGLPRISDPATAGSMFANVQVGDYFDLRGPAATGTTIKSTLGLMKVADVDPSADWIDVEIDTDTVSFFTDFVSTETGVSATLSFYPRGVNTNLSFTTTPY